MVGMVNKKKRIAYAEGNCIRCGKPLVHRINSKTKEPFIGCSNYPVCTYIDREIKGRFEYVRDSFPNKWKPKYSREVREIVEAQAESRTEIKYLFGVAFLLDYDVKQENCSKGLSLNIVNIQHKGKILSAVNFPNPSKYWNGEGYDCFDAPAPQSMAFVLQLEFAGNRHHDFGIFFSKEQHPEESNWFLGMVVEVDAHPDHWSYPDKDKFRDSLVKYPVIRLDPHETSPTKWFFKAQCIWDDIYLKRPSKYSWLDKYPEDIRKIMNEIE